VELRVLGSIEIGCDHRQLVLRSGQQRRLLAALVVQVGEVVSTDHLIEVLWGDRPPQSATKALQTHVSRLRAALAGCGGHEPLRTRVPGYVLVVEPGQLDAERFERLVGTARRQGDPTRRVALVDEALALWRGPALAEFAAEDFARAEAARLEGLRQVSVELRAEAQLELGQNAEVAVELEAVCEDQPLRETPHAQRMLALHRAGRSPEALAVYQAFRARLAHELGLDPSPALQDLERQILQHDPELTGPSVRNAVIPELAERVDAPAADVRLDVPVPPAATAVGDDVFVGRETELAGLVGTARAVVTKGSQVVLVTGEAGVGKSQLLAQLSGVLASDGWLVAVGRCPEQEAAPPAWAWTEVLEVVAERVPPGDLAARLAPLLTPDRPPEPATDASVGRFHLHRAVGAWLRAAASSGPLAVLVDDLHAADAETLALLVSAAEQLATAPVLLVTAFRPADVDDRLQDTLAVLARRSPHRLRLTGLTPAEVDQLVRELHDAPVDTTTIHAIAERTGGNPFYVRETVRLLASEGALVALSEVPDGVRDVLRRRLARLAPGTATVLAVVAAIGLEADVDVVATAAATEETDKIDESTVLDALDAALAAGLLTQPAPGTLRFVHQLARDTIYADIAPVRRARIHTRLATAQRELRPGDYPALARHHALAASTDTAALAVEYSVRAAELAEVRYADDAAADLYSQAVECHQRLPTAAGGTGDRSAERIDLLGRLLRAQVRAGALADARATRHAAVDLATQTGRPELLVEALTAWDQPTPWTSRPYATIDDRAVAALTRLLAHDDLPPAKRCRLLAALTAELAGEGDPRAARAAAEAVRLAQSLDDPALLAHALYEQARETRWDLETDQRARLAEQISRIGTTHDLVAYRWLGEYVSATAAAAHNDPAALHRHVEAGLELARTYQMAEPLGIGLCTKAMLAHIAGRFDQAERDYAEACTHLDQHGSPHGTGVGTLATVTIRVSQNRIAELAPLAPALQHQYGPPATDVAALALATAGHHEEARALLSDLPPLRPDFYFSIFATLRAMTAIELGHRELAEQLYATLLPLHDQLAGAASTSLALRPVAHTLAGLAHLLGHRTTTADHLAEAVTIADTWQAPTWRAQARHALAAITPAREL
jgi:DNA-binding SARP family transcriptional activator/energy-coupling factor transporter ATP-binding protein EcfA2